MDYLRRHVLPIRYSGQSDHCQSLWFRLFESWCQIEICVLFFVGMIVIAANAGGAWSPIGDVTTTMLWIGGQISSVNIIKTLILPSIVCMVVPLLYLQFTLKGELGHANASAEPGENNLHGDHDNIRARKQCSF